MGWYRDDRVQLPIRVLESNHLCFQLFVDMTPIDNYARIIFWLSLFPPISVAFIAFSIDINVINSKYFISFYVSMFYFMFLSLRIFESLRLRFSMMSGIFCFWFHFLDTTTSRSCFSVCKGIWRLSPVPITGLSQNALIFSQVFSDRLLLHVCCIIIGAGWILV